MKFTYTCKKISLNDSVKAYAEKKVGKLEKFFKEEPEASVTFSVEKKNRCIVEITLRGANGTLFRAVCEDADGDMRGAIDEAAAQIERKIRKNKTRLSKNLRAESIAPELPEEFEVHEESEFDIVRTKRFTVKPMSAEEAILQMNLLGHSFFVFRNTDDGDAISVVYRRNNGGYGIIETEEAED
ncbi:MAG: ribosome-associated translation inhibitor RaiA [Oscillospiraceae bacterium]|nr:ribosome-associated translation inhibitor RaiA [Oscillospiraceae bacterium]